MNPTHQEEIKRETHPKGGGSSSISIAAPPLGLLPPMNASTERRRQHHSSRKSWDSPGRKPRERQGFPGFNQPSLSVERSPGATHDRFLPPLQRSQMLAPTHASHGLSSSLPNLYFRGLDSLKPIYPLLPRRNVTSTRNGRGGGVCRTDSDVFPLLLPPSACLKGRARTGFATEAAGAGVVTGKAAVGSTEALLGTKRGSLCRFEMTVLKDASSSFFTAGPYKGFK